jgi:hypothetical protein
MTTFLIVYSYLPRLRDLMRERGIALCEAGFEMVEMRGLGSEAHAGCDAADARTFATGKMRLPMESLRIGTLAGRNSFADSRIGLCTVAPEAIATSLSFTVSLAFLARTLICKIIVVESNSIFPLLIAINVLSL